MEWTCSRSIGQHCLLLLMLLLYFIKLARGDLLCMCSTPECRDQKKSSCIAKYYCYVEFANVKGNRYVPQTRGCIDEPTPLNCERFMPPPNTYLATYCCDYDLCNRDNKMPKLPTRKRITRPQSDQADGNRTPPITPSPHLIDTAEKPGMWRRPFMNPMHIAGPIAAACIVLSMIIFVIFLIKRKESQESTDNLVYTDCDPALLAALSGQPERDDGVTPVLNPVLYNPFLKMNKAPV